MSCFAIFGANSEIAKALIELLAAEGHELVLLARNPAQMEDLRSGPTAKAIRAIIPFDALQPATHASSINEIFKNYDIAGVLIFFAVMHEQQECDQEWAKAAETINCNITGTISVLNNVIPHLEAKQKGFVSFISSVAGDRGRKSNYLYGSTKAALNTYLSGLRARMHGKGVLVQTVKLGPTNTVMLRKSGKAPFMITPERAAHDIWKNISKGREIIYVPWFWKYIMFIIRLIPECIFKRTNL